MNFTMTRPCPQCPFRYDIAGYLTREGAEAIAEGITTMQGTFTCHKTTIGVERYDEDAGEEVEEMVDGPNAEHCAGAMIMLEHMQQPNQMMRIAERLGWYDASKLDMSAPVFTDVEDFIDHHDG